MEMSKIKTHQVVAGTNASFSLDVSDLNLLFFSTFFLGPNTWKTRRMVLAV
jgi:hypothetical protein